MGIAERLLRIEKAMGQHSAPRHEELERAHRALSDGELGALIACYSEEGEWNRGAGLSEAQAELACDALRKLKLGELRDFRDLGTPPSRFLHGLGPNEYVTGIGYKYRDLSEEEVAVRIAALRKAMS